MNEGPVGTEGIDGAPSSEYKAAEEMEAKSEQATKPKWRSPASKFTKRYTDEDRAVVTRIVEVGWNQDRLKMDWDLVAGTMLQEFKALEAKYGERSVNQAVYRKTRDLIPRGVKTPNMSAAQKLRAKRLRKLGATVSTIKPTHHKRYYVPVAERRKAKQEAGKGVPGHLNGPGVARERIVQASPVSVAGLMPNFCCKCGWNIRAYVEQAAKAKLSEVE